ncbi:MAG: TrmB family transcriptional regulator [Candidatus Micrarchaeia archaeon]
MEIEKILEKLNFSISEIKVYKTLLALNTSSPKEIAKETKMQLPKVYNVLEALATKGLVITLPGKPVTYKVAPIELSLLPMVEEKEKEFENFKKQIKELSKELNKEVYKRKISLFQSHNLVRKVRIKGIKESKKEILRFMRFGKIDEEIFEEMEKAIERGVKIKILGPYDKERELTMRKYLLIGCAVRALDVPIPTIKEDIIDETIYYINFWDFIPTLEKPFENSWLVKIEDKATAKLAKRKFELLWKVSKKIS